MGYSAHAAGAGAPFSIPDPRGAGHRSHSGRWSTVVERFAPRTGAPAGCRHGCASGTEPEIGQYAGRDDRGAAGIEHAERQCRCPKFTGGKCSGRCGFRAATARAASHAIGSTRTNRIAIGERWRCRQPAGSKGARATAGESARRFDATTGWAGGTLVYTAKQITRSAAGPDGVRSGDCSAVSDPLQSGECRCRRGFQPAGAERWNLSSALARGQRHRLQPSLADHCKDRPG